MIEEADDCPEEIIISQNSPQHSRDCIESNIITDFSSPIKNDLEITDVSSPEIGFNKHSLTSIPRSKRKRSFRRSIFNSAKKPSLSINLSKKSPSNSFIKELSTNDSETSQDLEAVPLPTLNNDSVDKELHLSISNRISDKIEEVLDNSSYMVQIDDPCSQDTLTNSIDIFSKTADVDDRHSPGTYMPDSTFSGVKENKAVLDSSAALSIKPPKKGTLLEMAFKVATLMKNEVSLFSHELSVGLRTSRGSYVSDVLMVKSVYRDETCVVLKCIPLFDALSDHDCYETICIYISKTALREIEENSCVVVHFPLIAMFDMKMNCTVVFANDRVQSVSRKVVQESHNLIFSRRKTIELPPDSTVNTNIFRSLKTRNCLSILDAVVANPLVLYHSLTLKVLHMHFIVLNNDKFIRILTTDAEKQHCIIQIKQPNDREFPEISLDHNYTFVGFTVSQCLFINCDLKSSMEYHLSNTYDHDLIYILEPKIKEWDISLCHI